MVRSGRKQPYDPLSVCTFYFRIMDKELYMQAALDEAEKAFSEDEVPIGCVIVREGKIIAAAHNQKEKNKCSLYHAEMVAIIKACAVLNSWYLDECDLYVTLEPCMMCTGAIINSRIRKVYFAASDPKGGAFISNLKINEIKNINHYPEFEAGICQQEAAKLLQSFFQQKRKNKNKTIGKTVD